MLVSMYNRTHTS